DLCGKRGALFRQSNGFGRVLPKRDAFLEYGRTCLESKFQSTGNGLEQLRDRIIGVGIVLFRRRRRRPRSVPSAVSIRHRQRYLDESNSVGVAVMDAHDQRTATVEALDQMELPQRSRVIEWRAHQLAHQGLQLRSACSTPKRDTLDMRRDIEILVGFPIGAHRSLNYPLAEAAEAKETLVEH